MESSDPDFGELTPRQVEALAKMGQSRPRYGYVDTNCGDGVLTIPILRETDADWAMSMATLLCRHGLGTAELDDGSEATAELTRVHGMRERMIVGGLHPVMRLTLNDSGFRVSRLAQVWDALVHA